MRACKKLKYRPNIIASSLRSKKSYALGVVVPTFKHIFYARLVNYLEEECKKAGYHIILLQGPQEDPIRSGIKLKWQNFEFLLARQIDGLLMDYGHMSLDPATLKKLKNEKIPIVFMDVAPEDQSFPFVGTADFDGAKELADYFIKSGHRKIAFIAGPAGHYTSELRLAGYKKCLLENRIPYAEKLVLFSDYSTDGGHKATLELLDRTRDFSGIICANDYLAIGALSALNQKGITVPKDVSVAGFTGDEIGAHTIPSLTTMVQPVEEIAKKSVEIILSRLKESNKSVERILLPARLLERASVKNINGNNIL